jgi:hypothetical protein
VRSARPLVRRLRANQHEVFALTRSPDSAPALKEIGAEPVIADALDAAAVKAAVGRIRPDAVINELTSLPRHYTNFAAPEASRAAARDAGQAPPRRSLKPYRGPPMTLGGGRQGRPGPHRMVEELPASARAGPRRTSPAAGHRDEVWISVARDVVPRFSHMGYAAVALLAATGAINTLLLVGKSTR